jgi:hypothetical protein
VNGRGKKDELDSLVDVVCSQLDALEEVGDSLNA